MIEFEDFLKIDFRVGTILEAKFFEKAKKPAYQLLIDFGSEIGLKKSSAQITIHYNPKDLIGKQIFAVVNFKPRQIANFISEVLVTGFYDQNENVVLISPDLKIQNGAKLL